MQVALASNGEHVLNYCSDNISSNNPQMENGACNRSDDVGRKYLDDGIQRLPPISLEKS
jgi:hypothetical protein